MQLQKTQYVSAHRTMMWSRLNVWMFSAEKYLKITQAAKLSYSVFITKSCIYGAFIAFLVWKHQVGSATWCITAEWMNEPWWHCVPSVCFRVQLERQTTESWTDDCWEITSVHFCKYRLETQKSIFVSLTQLDNLTLAAVLSLAPQF